MKQVESHKKKLWIVNQKEPSEALRDFCTHDLIARFLAAREVSTLEEAYYYYGSKRPAFSSAHEIPQMSQAAERIEIAIKNSEKIVVYGDYDVDGTTSTALLVDVLKLLGANVQFYIPNRFTEGYGLNSKAVLQIKSQLKANLLVTCDCGITNFEEVKLANSFGLDVIVTDHHSLPENLPPAVAVINPKLMSPVHPLYWLPGVGVVYKLSEILLHKFGLEEHIPAMLDLVALGMIADLAPLRAENRLLVVDGLKVLNTTSRVGLQALLKECGYKADEEGVGFAMAPRINAAGRLNDGAEAVKLFLAAEELEAQAMARSLSSQNSARQDLCDSTFLQAIERIESELDLKKQRAIMLADKRWHHGVVGIVASRLVEKYNLPVFLAVEEDGKVKGSARGISSIDLFEEMNKHGHLFSKFGGHKAAAGYSLEVDKWKVFQEAFCEEISTKLTEEDFQATLSIDVEVDAREMSLGSLAPVWKLAPFGMGFAKPVLTLTEPAEVVDVIGLGKNKEHTKVMLRAGGKLLESVSWRTTPDEFAQAKRNGEMKVAFTPIKKQFAGKTFLQLELKDWMVESTSIEVSVPSEIQAEVLDLRESEDCHSVLLKFCSDAESSVIFAEGKSLKELEEIGLKQPCLSRGQKLKVKSGNLVFWTMPTNLPFIKGLIQECNPRKIILVGRNLKREFQVKSFLKDTLSFLRSFQKYEFQITLPEIASALESREETCHEALKLLGETGILSFKIIGETVNINLFNSPSKVKLDTYSLQSKLQEEERTQKRLLQISPQEIYS